MTTTTKKITLATLKSFVRKNEGKLFINVTSAFNGMIDGRENRNNGFIEARKTTSNVENSLGIEGAWCVGSSRDYLTEYSDSLFSGIEVSNSCGCFVIAIKK